MLDINDAITYGILELVPQHPDWPQRDANRHCVFIYNRQRSAGHIITVALNPDGVYVAGPHGHETIITPYDHPQLVEWVMKDVEARMQFYSRWH